MATPELQRKTCGNSASRADISETTVLRQEQFVLRRGRVTLVGHSSGAFSVNFHLLSPGSRGLFSQGILEGTALELWLHRSKAAASSPNAVFCASLQQVKDNGWYYAKKDPSRNCQQPPSGSLKKHLT